MSRFFLIRLLISGFGLIILSGISSLTVIADASTPEILILNSYHQGEDWSDNELAGILPSLKRAYPFLVPSVEHLDTKRFLGPGHMAFIHQYLKQKYHQKQFDLIFVLDNPALEFMTQLGREVFPEVPVVFAGVNGYRPEMIDVHDAITGIAEVQDIAGTIDLALTIHPQTKFILAVHDHTSSGLALEKDLMAVAARYQGRISLISTPDGSAADLVRQLKALPADSLVIILTYVTDKHGRTLTREESTRLITEASPVPVYAMHETRLGYGIVGGMLLEGREHGIQAAEMALKILSEKPVNLPVVENSRSRPVFDYHQLQRFNIPMDRLPPGSTVINRPVSFWEENRIPLLLIGSVCFCLLLIIAILVVSNTRIQKARKDLQRNRNTLQSLFDAIHESVCLFDKNNIILAANQTFAERVGKQRPEDCIGRSIFSFISADVAARRKVFVDQALSTGLLTTFEDERDGRWVYHSICPVLNPDGSVDQFAVYAIDITRRKQIEDALDESEARWRSYVQNAPYGIFVTDETGRYVQVNPAACRMTGYAESELLAMHVSDLLPPESRQDWMLDFDHLKQLGDMQAELIFTTKTGENRWWRLASVKLSETRFLGFTDDITERKKDVDALQDSESKYRSLYDTMNEGVILHDIVHDADGKAVDYILLDANPAFERITGIQRQNVVGRRATDVYGTDAAPYLDIYADVAKTGKPRIFETTFEPMQKSFSISVFSPSKNRFATVFSDITEQKRAKQEREKLQNQLLQAQKMESVGRLAGGVAHDFNNKLQTILGYTEMAIDDTDPDSALRANLLEIQAAAEGSAGLTRQLLAFARKQTICPRALDINDTITGLLKMLRRLIGENIDLVWKPGADIRPIRMDPVQIDQILVNLTLNARDAISVVGNVTIETENQTMDETRCAGHAEIIPGKYVVLAVSDTGTGMTKAIQDNLFEPFFTTKELGKGTGLGLATIYGIVRQNNGFIHVYSEPGQGTTFKLYFPQTSADEPETESAATHQPTARGDETILLVEDDETILTFGYKILERYGYRVLPAKNPEEAIDIALQHDGPIHLLITDVVMPGMNGRDLCARLHDHLPGLRSIFMSGYTANVIAHHGVIDKGIHFLQKPFSVQSLAAMVRSVLDA
ncbi:MAG: PAS domain S-box protein [Desulfatirhabdiaceae bacterium]